MKQIKSNDTKQQYSGYTVEMHRRVNTWTLWGVIKVLCLVGVTTLIALKWFQIPLVLILLAHISVFWIIEMTKHDVVDIIQKGYFIQLQSKLIKGTLPDQGRKTDCFWNIEYTFIYYISKKD